MHVNFSPMAGKIKFQEYTCGRFLAAYKDSVGFENEERILSELKMVMSKFLLRRLLD